MNEQRRVRLGVIGLGRFGMQHAETIDRLAECQLAAIVEPEASRLELARQRFSQAMPFDNLLEAIEQSKVDGWIIASSTASHIAVAQPLLAAGKRIFIEKPLAASLSEAASIAAFVQPDSSNLMLGHVVLFGSEFQELLHQTRHRTPIRFIDAVRHRPLATLAAYPGESPLYLTMVHDLYCIQVLMHRKEPVHMSAQLIQNASRQTCGACAQLQWADGAIASLAATFLTPKGMPDDGFDRLEVFGSDWASRMVSNPRPLQFWDDQAHFPMTLEIRHRPNVVSGMLAEELRCYCRVLCGETSVPIGATYEDALQIQRWLEKLSSIAVSSDRL